MRRRAVSLQQLGLCHVGCRHFCGHASSRLWRALATICRDRNCCSSCGASETADLPVAQTESIRCQGPTAGPSAGHVRRQSGPPRVRTRLNNQETQILMTTLNGPTSPLADDM